MMACIFVIVLGGAMVGAVHNIDTDLLPFGLVAVCILFTFLFDEIYPAKPKSFKVEGKISPEKLKDMLEEQEMENAPTGLATFARWRYRLLKWGNKNGFRHIDDILWGVVVMLLSGIAFGGLCLWNPQGSEDMVGGVGAFFLISLCVGAFMTIKGAFLSIVDFFL